MSNPVKFGPQRAAGPFEYENTRRAKGRIALVLSSGPYIGDAHIGVIRSLERHGIPVDLVVGTSVGALAGMIYCAGLSTEQIAGETQTLRIHNLFSPRDPHDGFTDMGPLRTFIEAVIGPSRDIGSFERQFACIAADAMTGESVVIDSGNAVSAVLASMAMPGLIRPVRHVDRYLVDGVVVQPIPVSTARALGADFVIAVDIHLPRHGDHVARNPTESYAHCFDMAIRRLCLIELAAADVVIRPDVGRIPFTGNHTIELIHAGERACDQAIHRIEELLTAANTIEHAGRK